MNKIKNFYSTKHAQKIVISILIIAVVLVGAVMATKLMLTPAISPEEIAILDEISKDNLESAISGLERPDNPISAEMTVEPKARLQEGFDYIENLDGEDFIPYRCNAWQNTEPSMALQVQQALELGYNTDVENSQWFDSNAKQKNVYQFVVVMSKKGEEDIVFSGNYLTGIKSVNIKAMTGDYDISSFLSPDSGPQAYDLGTE